MKETPEKDRAEIYNILGFSYLQISNSEAVKFANKALELNKDLTDRQWLFSKEIIGRMYYNKGDLDSAKEIFLQAFKQAKENDSILPQNASDDVRKLAKQDYASFANLLGVINKNQGNYQEAIKYYQENLSLSEELKDSISISYTLVNIANVYYYFGIDFGKALINYERAYKIMKNFNNGQAAMLLNNIGLVWLKKNDLAKALEYFKQSYEILSVEKYESGIVQAQNNMASVYMEMGEFTRAMKLNKQALELCYKLEDLRTATFILKDLARIYYKMGKYSESIKAYNEALKKFEQMALKKETADVYRDISDVYAHTGNYQMAYESFKGYSTLKDSILGEEYLNQIQELDKKYESDKKEQQIKAQQAENRRQQFIIYAFIGFIAVILIFAFLLFQQFNEKKKANILLARQNDEITNQRDQIMHQKKEITDSIHYASRIQMAVLPPQNILEANFADYFVLFKPRDIVSGDFYWMNEKDGKVIFTAADCTGHGVPGAFMSMLGMAFLNQIVSDGNYTNAADILNLLRLQVVNSLHQRGENSSQTKDGMDISFCMYEPATRKLQYAGAFNSMYLIRNGELIEGDADRMPIGVHEHIGNTFTNHIFDLIPGDTVYVFTDGYEDQFGGEKGKKFMAKRFKQLLVDIQPLSMAEQRELLDKTIIEWRGEIDQIDDILVMGVRV